ncbi:MAG TPA: DUF3800 domain-containing protein, partial [Candidatus Paceibacterota bacterium]|nr:DUF3800 domain-containing protein [Candidatus Paceibacterota bacterium]
YIMEIPRDMPPSHQFFLDETGDHGLTSIDERFPLFLLAGCLFSEESYTKVSNELNQLKSDIFDSTDVILHSRDIRKCEGAFQVLFDLEIKKRFYERLNQILFEADFKIIAASIDKKKHLEKYGPSADDPYKISLSYILERLVFCTDNGKSTTNTVGITIERRGKKEDGQLLAHYNRVSDKGTFYVNSPRFKSRVVSFEMKLKRENILGLQIADLCAYPLARHMLNTGEPYIPYEIISKKLYCNSKGETNGYGLKSFP